MTTTRITPPAGWLAGLEAGVEWSDPDHVYLQVDGYDIVGVEIDGETGKAVITVWDRDVVSGFPNIVGAETEIDLFAITRQEGT